MLQNCALSEKRCRRLRLPCIATRMTAAPYDAAGTRIMKTATIAQPASFRFKRQSAAHLRARPPRASRALFVCASHGASSSQSDFDTAEAKDSWAELGGTPQPPSRTFAFRASCHSLAAL